MAEFKTNYQSLADGRTLAYCEYGDPLGIPIFYAHGGPGSRLEGAIFHDAAIKHGFRLIATDRPGMGQSTLKPDRKFLDYPYDISELADRLGIEKFGVMGWSGGGPHTVVCAYEIPERLLFNIALCGYTNFAELPGAAGMFSTKVDQVSVEIAKRFPRMYHLFFSFFSMSLKFFPNLLYKTTSESLNDSDKEIMLDPAFKTHFLSDQREAIAQGTKGVMIDSVIHYDDWGFRLKEITSKVHVFHGTEDKLVPIAFGRHLAENIPNCDFHVMENQGHMFPISHQNLIFATAKSEL